MTTTQERKLAALVERMESLFEGDDSFPDLVSRVKAIQTEVKEFKGLNVENVVSEIDKIRATQEQLIKAIRFSKRGFYVPGAEDHEFSMLKAIVGVRTGKWKGAEHEKEVLDASRTKASHIVGDDAAGGNFVPDQVIPDVIAAIYTRSVMINLDGEGQTRVSVLEGLTGGNVKVPKFDGGLIAYWIGEEDTYVESITSVGDMTMNPKKMGVLIRLTDTMRRLQGFGFENLLRQDMIRAAAKKLDWTVMFGRGTDNMPRGIVNHSNIKVYRAENGTVYDKNTDAGQTALDAVSDWDGGELTYDGLQNMRLALEEDDIDVDPSAAFISSPRYFNRLKQIKVENYSAQSSGQPYLIGAPYISDARLREIIGDFDKSNQIPSNALPGASMDLPTDNTDEKHTTVIDGNLNNVVVGRWGGVEIEDDSGRGLGFTSDHTYVKLRLYADVGIREERAIIVCPDALARD